jgi:hypothetical protein
MKMDRAARSDQIKVECVADVLIPPRALLRLAPTTRVLDLELRLRCRECDAKGKAVVSVSGVMLARRGLSLRSAIWAESGPTPVCASTAGSRRFRAFAGLTASDKARPRNSRSRN